MHKYLLIVKSVEQAQRCIYKCFIYLFFLLLFCLFVGLFMLSFVARFLGSLFMWHAIRAMFHVFFFFWGIVKWTYNGEVMLLHQHVLSEALLNGLWQRNRFSATTAKLLGHGFACCPVFIMNRNLSYVRASRRQVGYPYIFFAVFLALPCKWRDISFRILSNPLFIYISAVPPYI